MANILVVPDIHGEQSRWVPVANAADRFDKIVFLGDYCDNDARNAHVSDRQIQTNLEMIINFKKNHPDKVVLLLGNHDMHYWSPGKYQCSRFRRSMLYSLNKNLLKHRSLFKVAHQEGNMLFTHAGMSAGWLNANLPAMTACGLENGNYAEALNNMADSKFADRLHDVSAYRGGSAEWGGITWADMMETKHSMVPDLYQIVGHTPVEWPEYHARITGQIIYTDCLGGDDETNKVLLSIDTETQLYRFISLADLSFRPSTPRGARGGLLNTDYEPYVRPVHHYTVGETRNLGEDMFFDMDDIEPETIREVSRPEIAAIEERVGNIRAELDAMDEDENHAALRRQEAIERDQMEWARLQAQEHAARVEPGPTAPPEDNTEEDTYPF